MLFNNINTNYINVMDHSQWWLYVSLFCTINCVRKKYLKLSFTSFVPSLTNKQTPCYSVIVWKLIVAHIVKKLIAFMEVGCLSPCSHEPTIEYTQIVVTFVKPVVPAVQCFFYVNWFNYVNSWYTKSSGRIRHTSVCTVVCRLVYYV